MKENKLAKGAFLYLKQDKNNLVYSAKLEVEDYNKEITIEIDSRSKDQVEKMIKSAYLRGYNIFRIRGDTVTDRIKELKDIISRLAAIEIMEQTKNVIVFHEILDKHKNHPDKIINRMDMVLRVMLQEIQDAIGIKNVFESVFEMEKELNRLELLSQRIIVNALERPEYASELGKNNFQLLSAFKMTNQMEMFGDSLKDLSKYSDKMTQVIKEYFSRVHARFISTMKAYYTKDIRLASELASKDNRDDEKFEKLMVLAKSENPLLLMSIKNIISLLEEMAHLILNENT
jgi:hypothetical protein